MFKDHSVIGNDIMM